MIEALDRPDLAAAALRCIGGQMQGRLVFRNEDEKGRARKIGITDFNRKYSLMDLAKGDVMFAATGVTESVTISNTGTSAFTRYLKVAYYSGATAGAAATPTYTLTATIQ